MFAEMDRLHFKIWLKIPGTAAEDIIQSKCECVEQTPYSRGPVGSVVEIGPIEEEVFLALYWIIN